MYMYFFVSEIYCAVM